MNLLKEGKFLLGVKFYQLFLCHYNSSRATLVRLPSLAGANLLVSPYFKIKPNGPIIYILAKAILIKCLARKVLSYKVGQLEVVLVAERACE